MSRERLLDAVGALPTITICAFAIVGLVIQIAGLVRADMSWSTFFAIAVRAASGLFAAMQIVMLVARRLPLAKLHSWSGRAVALLGANAGALLFLLPKGEGSFMRDVTSALVTILGLMAASLVMWHLGRAFAIFPQARVLVRSGPYAYLRHPLYVAETVAALGVMLQYRQPWSLLVFLFGTSLQVARANYEEEVLRQQFPSYAYYALRTPRWFPALF